MVSNKNNLAVTMMVGMRMVVMIMMVVIMMIMMAVVVIMLITMLTFAVTQLDALAHAMHHHMLTITMNSAFETNHRLACYQFLQGRLQQVTVHRLVTG